MGAVPRRAVVTPADLVVQLVHQQHAGVFACEDEAFLWGETCILINITPRKGDIDQCLWVGRVSQVTIVSSGGR